MIDLSRYPGGDLVAAGLEDLGAGRLTVNALLVLVGAPRLRAAGLDVPRMTGDELPEHRLYRALQEAGEVDPYSAYNALIRRLVSFEAAYEQFGG